MSEKQQTRTQVKKKASFTLVTVESMYQEMCLSVLANTRKNTKTHSTSL